MNDVTGNFPVGIRGLLTLKLYVSPSKLLCIDLRLTIGFATGVCSPYIQMEEVLPLLPSPYHKIAPAPYIEPPKPSENH